MNILHLILEIRQALSKTYYKNYTLYDNNKSILGYLKACFWSYVLLSLASATAFVMDRDIDDALGDFGELLQTVLIVLLLPVSFLFMIVPCTIHLFFPKIFISGDDKESVLREVGNLM